MTARDLLERTLAIINERDSSGAVGDIGDYEENSIELINTLCDMLWISNRILQESSAFHWQFAPSQLKSLDEEILLHPALCAPVLPFGLAYLLLLEEDRERAERYYVLFRQAETAALNYLSKSKRQPVRDVYFT